MVEVVGRLFCMGGKKLVPRRSGNFCIEHLPTRWTGHRRIGSVRRHRDGTIVLTFGVIIVGVG